MLPVKQKKLTLAILMAAGAVSLAGCGGGGSSSTEGSTGGGGTTAFTLSGTAVDGLLAYATICIDENNNYKCDTDERFKITNADGSYRFTDLTDADAGRQVVVEADATTEGNETDKELVLVSKLPSTITGDVTDQVVSPLTTLIDSGGITEDALKSVLGLDAGVDLRADYTQGGTVTATNTTAGSPYLFALQVAQKIADELQANKSASSTSESILAGEAGIIQQLASVLNTANVYDGTKTPEEFMQSLFANIEAEVVVNTVSNASVSITLKSASGTVISNADVVAVAYDVKTNSTLTADNGFEQLIGQTDAQGNLRLSLPTYSDISSLNLHLTISKDGFADLEKVIKNIQADNDIPLNYTASPIAITTVKADSTTGLGFGSAMAASLTTGKPVVTFALVNINGQNTILTGGAAAQAMADPAVDTKLSAQIPANRIGDTVSALQIEAGQFDPSNVQERESFPGEFKGTGSTDTATTGVNSDIGAGKAQSAADGDEYRLVSTSFAQMRITDQNGEAFTLAAPEATAQADAENPTIYLSVPENTYSTITEDMHSSDAGVQVPIYVYRSGQGWLLIGFGTLVTADGSGGYAEYSGGVDPVTPTSTLYAKVEITAGNEWIEWINLDWPIKTGSSLVEINYSGKVIYDGDDAENYDGSGYISLPDGGSEWIYVSKGKFSYTTLIDGSTAGNATLNLYNNRTGQYQEAFSFSEDDDAATMPIEYTASAVMENPYQCKVSGQLTAEAGNENSVAWRWLTVYDTNYRYYEWFNANEKGAFEAAIPCNTEMLVNYDWDKDSVGFNTNDSKESTESSDNGSTVSLNDIQLINQKPSVWGYTQDRLVVPSSGTASFNIAGYAWDNDSDEVTLNFTCPSSSSAQASYASSYGSKACSISSQDLLNDQNNLEWSVTATDPAGATSTYNGSILVEKDNINHAPKIWRMDRDGSAVSCSRSTDGGLNCYDSVKAGTYAYSVIASDSDGDSLLYTSDKISDNIVNVTAQGSQTIEVSVTEKNLVNPLTSTATLTVNEIVNKAPSVYPSLSQYSATLGSSENIEIYAYIWDDFDFVEDMNVRVDVQDASGNSVAVPTFVTGSKWTIPIYDLALGSYSVIISVTDVDGLETTRSTQFTIANSDLPVIDYLYVTPTTLLVSDLAGSSVSGSFYLSDDNLAALTVTVDLLDSTEQVVQTLDVTPSYSRIKFEFSDVSALSLGSYQVRVTLQDSDNDAVTQKSLLNVTDEVTDEESADLNIIIQ